jgi:predicted nucleotidyltransferase
MFGLRDNDIEQIVSLLQQFPEVVEACIFGSRAKGNYKNGSDVDIALKGENLNYRTISRISAFLNEETLMPYKFDVINFNDLTNADLLNHINRVGQKFYEAKNQQLAHNAKS